jgi:glycosyltransferase involved in cell wall biosynthesis
MSHTPLISIIIPSYNQGNFIEETIKSVLDLNYDNIEFIVVDGGSTDGTKEILQKYSGYFSKLIIEHDKGQSDAIQKGIRAATGDFITWINSDDLLMPDFVRNILSYFDNNPQIDFIYGNCEIIDSNSNRIGVHYGNDVEWPDILLEHHLPIPQQGATWRKAVTENIEGPKINYHYVLDREYFLRIIANYTSMYVDICLGKFRYHPEAKSIKHQMKWISELKVSYKELCDELNIKNKNRALILSSVSIHCGYIFLNGRDYISFLKCLYDGILYDKFIFFRPYTYKKIIHKIRRVIINE